MLQERILKSLDMRDDLDQRKLAEVAGVNESSISRYLRGHEELNFESVLKIVKHVFEDKEKDVMAEYVLTQKSQNARYAMEYCSIYRLGSELEILIERLRESSNPTDREWGRMYGLLLLQQTNESKLEVINQLERFIPKALELQILKKLIMGYIYHDLSENDLLFDQLQGLDSQIDKVRSTFIRNCFNIRLGLSLNYVYLFRNEVERSRDYSNMVINQEVAQHVKGIAYHHLGHSYMFEDYDKAKFYMDKAIHINKSSDRLDLIKYTEYNITYLKSYWNINFDFPYKLEQDQDIFQFIFYLIQKGDKLKADKYMNKVEYTKLSNYDKAFYLYYKGRINGDDIPLYESVRMFRIIGDLFHIKLPLQALNDLGEKSYVLEILAE